MTEKNNPVSGMTHYRRKSPSTLPLIVEIAVAIASGYAIAKLIGGML